MGINDHDPVPGLYAVQLVKGGVFVPLAIFYPCPIDFETGEPTERSRHLVALLGGDTWVEPTKYWPWCYAAPLKPASYERLVRIRQWAKGWAPDDPASDPTKPVDHMRCRPPF